MYSAMAAVEKLQAGGGQLSGRGWMAALVRQAVRPASSVRLQGRRAVWEGNRHPARVKLHSMGQISCQRQVQQAGLCTLSFEHANFLLTQHFPDRVVGSSRTWQTGWWRVTLSHAACSTKS